MNFNLTRPDDVDRLPIGLGYCLREYCPLLEFPPGAALYKRFLLWNRYNGVTVYSVYACILLVIALRGIVPPVCKRALQRVAQALLLEEGPSFKLAKFDSETLIKLVELVAFVPILFILLSPSSLLQVVCDTPKDLVGSFGSTIQPAPAAGGAWTNGIQSATYLRRIGWSDKQIVALQIITSFEVWLGYFGLLLAAEAASFLLFLLNWTRVANRSFAPLGMAVSVALAGIWGGFEYVHASELKLWNDPWRGGVDATPPQNVISSLGNDGRDYGYLAHGAEWADLDGPERIICIQPFAQFYARSLAGLHIMTFAFYLVLITPSFGSCWRSRLLPLSVLSAEEEDHSRDDNIQANPLAIAVRTTVELPQATGVAIPDSARVAFGVSPIGRKTVRDRSIQASS